MRLVAILFFFLYIASSLCAQELTGKWTGYFVPNNEVGIKIYNYEITITENEAHQLTATTSTFLSGTFSAKAMASGFHSVKSNLVNLEETKFEKLEVSSNVQACLMTNYLTFSVLDGRAVLQGTYLSTNTAGGRDCGGGKVYLEKLLPLTTLNSKSNAANSLTKKGSFTTSLDQQKQSGDSKFKKINQSIKALNRGSNTNTTKSNKSLNKHINSIDNKQVVNINNTEIVDNTMNSLPKDPISIESKKIQKIDQDDAMTLDILPWVIMGRENKLIKQITTSSKTLSIDFYDNGTIDNDSIAIYDNKKLSQPHKRLSYKAVHMEIKFYPGVNEREIIIVAENMGSIPPNTALVVLNDGNKRQEFFITTTDKVNARFVFIYKPEL